MKPAHIALLALLALLGAAHAASYATVADAVKALPELSTLNTNLQGTNLTKSFGDPAFVGTVFLPTNDALTSLSDKVGGDFSALIADNPDQAYEIFSYHVVPGQALLSSALKDGTTLKTQSGETLAVTIANGVVSVNGQAVSKANVVAGKAIIHEINGALLPPDLAQLLDASTTDTADPFADLTATNGDAAAGAHSEATTGTDVAAMTTTATTTKSAGASATAGSPSTAGATGATISATTTTPTTSTKSSAAGSESGSAGGVGEAGGGRGAQETLVRLANAFNVLTGYDTIERIKLQVEATDARLAALRRQLQAAKHSYEERLGHQRALSKEMAHLLQRKSSWGPSDVARFTDVYASEHANEAAVAEAKARYEEAGEAVELAQADLMHRIRERYTQEQLWGDKIRRAATWWTWSLMGLQAAALAVAGAAVGGALALLATLLLGAGRGSGGASSTGSSLGGGS
ncbi:putative Sensitive to high expression protein 9 like protein [Monoraphidium neglectum]|uniref:Putative Sensitive to high expression protein 9 like protein n=1 Tax=Monoraphidium neglectum TaxID=145388 RepID=A0A0D2K216_9CHLO|nr:putative Sensitive to high expression protein 9 like protein [Monoraphidium neglectum]KIZ04598.1 putative Sensitive to high expression protein 9 like protein [Monoraphidium neglectum]|eukprot:XP_013903617.1 putative Sensitive to high expression protein 9 like protein [Monoraphidium neglectum]